MKKITILGVSGSIGRQCIEIIDEHEGEFELIGISVHNQIDYALELIKRFKSIKYVAIKDEEDAKKVQTIKDELNLFIGKEGLEKLCSIQETDLLVNALVGFVGLVPTLTAIKNKINVAIANKESLVVAGHLITKEVEKQGVELIPVDSEHSAIMQCLNGEKYADIKNIYITASGGPFLHKNKEELTNVTLEQALKHPTWSMGAKISIDSATLVNKGLEVIEAHWLFKLPYEQIKVLIQPQSIIHSMVEYKDGAIIAQLGTPSMKIPIAYAMCGKTRKKSDSSLLDITKLSKLDFITPNLERYKTLKLAYEAGKIGHSMPLVYNTANEAAVNYFIQGKIKFTQIEELIEMAMSNHKLVKDPSIEELLEIDKLLRQEISSYLKED